jgi:hypothetical protein
LTIAAADNVSLIDIESLALACRGRAVVVDSFFAHSFRLGRLIFLHFSLGRDNCAHATRRTSKTPQLNVGVGMVVALVVKGFKVVG